MFLANGFLSLLVDRDRLQDYWLHMLREYVGHPASGKTACSVPLSLYGVPLASFSWLKFELAQIGIIGKPFFNLKSQVYAIGK